MRDVGAIALEAIDRAFEAHVGKLFEVFCAGSSGMAGGSEVRFAKGFEIALRTRERAQATINRIAPPP